MSVAENFVAANLLMVVSYGMRLNGAILEGPEMISFCEIRRRSYTTTTPQRNITPPPERLPSTSSASNMSWASWSSNPEDIADRPPLGATPDTSEYNPWVVSPEDTQDEIDAGAEKLSDTGEYTMEESSMWLILFYHSIAALVDGEGVFIDVPSSSRGAQSFGALYGRQVTQTICVNSMP